MAAAATLATAVVITAQQEGSQRRTGDLPLPIGCESDEVDESDDSDDDPFVPHHYTTSEGRYGILGSQAIYPSLIQNNPRDARYGDGVYASDITPGTRSNAQLSRAFVGTPFHGNRFTHYVSFDASGLGAVQGRPHVYLIPTATQVSLVGRLVGSGAN